MIKAKDWFGNDGKKRYYIKRYNWFVALIIGRKEDIVEWK